jgi:hypothetical protein
VAFNPPRQVAKVAGEGRCSPVPTPSLSKPTEDVPRDEMVQVEVKGAPAAKEPEVEAEECPTPEAAEEVAALAESLERVELAPKEEPAREVPAMEKVEVVKQECEKQVEEPEVVEVAKVEPEVLKVDAEVEAVAVVEVEPAAAPEAPIPSLLDNIPMDGWMESVHHPVHRRAAPDAHGQDHARVCEEAAEDD